MMIPLTTALKEGLRKRVCGDSLFAPVLLEGLKEFVFPLVRYFYLQFEEYEFIKITMLIMINMNILDEMIIKMNK